ncbi:MAG: D-sedoheptulose 7-phosphate isomerase [Phormidesmis sp.]
MKSLIKQLVDEQIAESVLVKQALASSPEVITAIQEAAQKCVAVYQRGNKILIAGNGGSAADAQHMAAELSGRFNFDRPGIPAIALTANSSAVTAIANDYGYEKVFSRQTEAYGQAGDLFIGISTSGNSKNILAAIAQCQAQNMETIGLTGSTGGQMAQACDVCIQIPSQSTPRVQECHILVVHLLCAAVEEVLFGEYSGGNKTPSEKSEAYANPMLLSA